MEGEENSQHASRTSMSRVTWEDNVVSTLLDICIELTELGHKPGTHLDAKGYELCEKKLLEKTGLKRTRTHLKNKLEKLRKDWQLWKTIGAQTGIVWNPINNTWDGANDTWWENFKKIEPTCEKFRYRGIKFADQLERLFDGTIAIGESVYIPGSAANPFLSSERRGTNDLDVEDDFLSTPTVGSTPASTTNASSSSKKRCHIQSANEDISSMESYFLKMEERRQMYDYTECLNMVKQIGLTEGSEIFMYAMMKLEKQVMREVFMKIQPDSLKRQWLEIRFMNWKRTGEI